MLPKPLESMTSTSPGRANLSARCTVRLSAGKGLTVKAGPAMRMVGSVGCTVAAIPPLRPMASDRVVVGSSRSAAITSALGRSNCCTTNGIWTLRLLARRHTHCRGHVRSQLISTKAASLEYGQRVGLAAALNFLLTYIWVIAQHPPKRFRRPGIHAAQTIDKTLNILSGTCIVDFSEVFSTD